MAGAARDRCDSMTSVRRSASLRALVALALAVLSLLAVAAVALTTERSASREAREQVYKELAELAFQLRYRLDRGMFERFRDIQVASSLDSLRAGSTEAKRRVMERLQQTYPDYAWIGFADPQGMVLASTGGLLEASDVSERPWFQAGRAGPYVGDVHDALLLARLLAAPGEQPPRLLDLAAPVYMPDGRLAGVLGAHLNWSWAEEVLASILRPRRQDERIAVFVLSADGTVLAGPADSIGRQLPLTAMISRGRDGVGGVVTWPDGRDYVTGHSSSEGYRYYPGLGWHVLARQPVEQAFAPVRALQREVALVGVVLAVLLVAIGWLLAAWIAQPLRAVSVAADRLRAGDGSVTIPVSDRFAELVTLTGSLQALLDALTKKEAALRGRTEEAERRQRFLDAILTNMQDALYVNKGGRIAFANEACVGLFGAADVRELLDRSSLELYHPDDHAIIEARRETIQVPGTKMPVVEHRIVRSDGSAVAVEASAISYVDDSGPAILVMLRDITARKATERQLQHAQRLEAVGQLTGGMAHDFNNLLAVVVGNLDLLEAKLERDAEARDLADDAMQAALRGAELTRQLLAFSRRQSLEPKVFDVNVLVGNTTQLLRRTLGERIVVHLQLAEGLWPAIADPAQVESALVNLAINARDAMPEGGRLTIETGNKHLDARYAAENLEVTPGDYVMLAVSDTGTGIPADLLDRVFEPFFTTKSEGKGSGLGLAMIYGFAKQSGGHVKIYSEPGHGTTVRLYLPRAGASEVAAATQPAAAPARPTAPITVLVVDDNAPVRRIAAQLVTDLGYQVIEAASGAEALDVLRQDRPIDLLFTDVVMPGGLTGDELARVACELRPGLKVLFTSGFTHAAIGNGQRPAQTAGHPLITKPYRKEDLARRLAEVLR
jgi:PAS domain S-box-containing protein